MMKFGRPALFFLVLMLAVSYFFGSDSDPAAALARNGALVAISVGLLVAAFAQPRINSEAVVQTPEVPRQVPASPAPIAQTHAGMPKGETDVLALIALLQQKGRLVDFLMDDVSKYPDAQVGAAARVVHQGCSAVVREYFDIQPVHAEGEGSALTLDKNYDPHSYRLLGRVTGEPPFRGRVLHRGWLTTSVHLPQPSAAGGPVANRVIAPAEVELV